MSKKGHKMHQFARRIIKIFPAYGYSQLSLLAAKSTESLLFFLLSLSSTIFILICTSLIPARTSQYFHWPVKYELEHVSTKLDLARGHKIWPSQLVSLQAPASVKWEQVRTSRKLQRFWLKLRSRVVFYQCLYMQGISEWFWHKKSSRPTHPCLDQVKLQSIMFTILVSVYFFCLQLYI